MVSDHRLLKWFALYARETPSFQKYLSNPIQSLSLPSLNLHNAVVCATASKTILDAMKLMSEEGVSSIAVVEDTSGTLLSAVSVTDIGKVWCLKRWFWLEVTADLFRLSFHPKAIKS